MQANLRARMFLAMVPSTLQLYTRQRPQSLKLWLSSAGGLPGRAGRGLSLEERPQSRVGARGGGRRRVQAQLKRRAILSDNASQRIMLHFIIVPLLKGSYRCRQPVLRTGAGAP